MAITSSDRDGIQEDWVEDCARVQTAQSKTLSMVARERDGLPPYEPMPDGVEMMSYSAFYDSMFELADAECGRTGNTEAASHSFFLTHFFFPLL